LHFVKFARIHILAQNVMEIELLNRIVIVPYNFMEQMIFVYVRDEVFNNF